MPASMSLLEIGVNLNQESEHQYKEAKTVAVVATTLILLPRINVLGPVGTSPRHSDTGH